MGFSGTGWEKRGSLKNERYLQTWVIRILLNVCHDIQRHSKREVPVEELPDRPAAAADSIDLRDALFRLTEKERVSVILHEYQILIGGLFAEFYVVVF